MKKIFSILLTAFVALSTVSMTSCGKPDADAKAKWTDKGNTATFTYTVKASAYGYSATTTFLYTFTFDNDNICTEATIKTTGTGQSGETLPDSSWVGMSKAEIKAAMDIMASSAGGY